MASQTNDTIDTSTTVCDEPWRFEPSLTECQIYTSSGAHVGVTHYEDRAERIVTCVNACAGIPNELLSLLNLAALTTGYRVVTCQDCPTRFLATKKNHVYCSHKCSNRVSMRRQKSGQAKKREVSNACS